MKDQQPVQKKNSRVLGILIVVIIILIALGVYSHYKQKAAQQPPASSSSPTSTPNNQNPTKTMLPTPKTISSFNLTDDSGKPFTNENLKGHWTFMFFGFSGCADVCPTTLTELNKMYQQLNQGTATQLPQVVFVSVDPERDTLNVLHNYVKNFNPNFIGATGSAENLNVFVKDLGVYFAKVPKEGNNYGMNHSSQIYIFNPEGNWVGILNYPQPGDQLAENYKTLVNQQTT